MSKLILSLLFVTIACTHFSCNEKSSDANASVVNLSHLNHLYVPVTFANGTRAAGIYIYSEAPDYHHVADSDEGFSCVDDVARAVQVYLRSNAFQTDSAVQNKVVNLTRFLLEMQSANGYFYNFLMLDGQINTLGQTSEANANWWSWRALYALTEASPAMRKLNLPLSQKMDSAIHRLVKNIKSDLIILPLRTQEFARVSMPQYFPAGSASDQASIIILSLINYCSENNDSTLHNYIRTLTSGLVETQKGSEGKFPYGCFLSWENVWHAYGNDQAYALFKAGKFFNDTGYTQSALREVNFFYPWLLEQGLLSSFTIRKTDSNYVKMNPLQFDQIAYGIRPMLSATLEAYEITGNTKYATLARQIAAWFFGKNIAGAEMYNIGTGRCYDGIISAGKVNRNSGAESTIEALLAMQLMEKHNLLDSLVTD